MVSGAQSGRLCSLGDDRGDEADLGPTQTRPPCEQGETGVGRKAAKIFNNNWSVGENRSTPFHKFKYYKPLKSIAVYHQICSLRQRLKVQLDISTSSINVLLVRLSQCVVFCSNCKWDSRSKGNSRASHIKVCNFSGIYIIIFIFILFSI